MQVILISENTGKTRTFNIMPRHWLIAVGVAVFVLLFASAFFSWLSVQLRLPVLQDLVLQTQAQAYRESQTVIHNNLQLMASKLGELQAQVQELSNIGERISNMTNAPVTRNKPGQGGPMVEFVPTINNLQREIDRFAQDVERHSEDLTLLESSLVEQRVLRRFLPTSLPIASAPLGSPFGFRVDPFNNRRAMHEGLDFTVGVGTPVYAAANGIVVGTNYHGEYGNLIVIDHGLDLVTRYAHLSRTHVNIGQAVRQGQMIGASGNSGRSSGPHLHFEVRSRGVALNPLAFLKQQSPVNPGNIAQQNTRRLFN